MSKAIPIDNTKSARIHPLIEAIDEKNTSEKMNPIFPSINGGKTKNEIDEYMENVDSYFMNFDYNSPNFMGWSEYECEKFTTKMKDPNIFDDPIYFRIKRKTKKNGIVEPLKEKIIIDVEIETLEDLIKLIDNYPINDKVEYNINMSALHKIKDPLIELNNMIGMKELKENIVDQILFYLQELHKVNNTTSVDFLHTVIYGPPGTGKTETAKILGRIFANLGILKRGTFKKVTRSDLIAGYLGQTALKTKDVITECLGGCLFIDEAYALGNSDKRDSFSKECIDTLCEALSDHKDNIMVIIAGYEKELNECFFAYNQGLNSRFTWRFKTDDYKAEDLYKIFIKKVNDIKWTIDTNDKKINYMWFEKNMCYFKYYGRDIEILLSKIKIAHSRRVFCKSLDTKTKLIYEDLEKGLKIFLKNEEVKNRKENNNQQKYLQTTMYI
jgi:SpoVK/Ycf46/Vps4 family AAA+-type ATPase